MSIPGSFPESPLMPALSSLKEPESLTLDENGKESNLVCRISPNHTQKTIFTAREDGEAILEQAYASILQDTSIRRLPGRSTAPMWSMKDSLIQYRDRMTRQKETEQSVQELSGMIQQLLETYTSLVGGSDGMGVTPSGARGLKVIALLRERNEHEKANEELCSILDNWDELVDKPPSLDYVYCSHGSIRKDWQSSYIPRWANTLGETIATGAKAAGTLASDVLETVGKYGYEGMQKASGVVNEVWKRGPTDCAKSTWNWMASTLGSAYGNIASRFSSHYGHWDKAPSTTSPHLRTLASEACSDDRIGDITRRTDQSGKGSNGLSLARAQSSVLQSLRSRLHGSQPYSVASALL
ncbi:hypothetical protein BD324DRAFT_622816 [Kockovaella imperatae]|uniref:Uncharacterized protein n=1 Tax=Kockovaella imperatae TaxID=4999 RepID=A0A1Y1UJE6_9TREE|nr:hypothetical protein BD324DRAFT_622816 [Kockovaella imperatae]ORX37667.1 hypothetical protein BD324DRAFT_622816 [Kockovaella imperatae]